MFRDGRGRLVRTPAKPRPPDGRLRAGKNAARGRCSTTRRIDERWIVVHLNELTEEDFARLESGPRFHVAHCPRSSRYFQHRPFALRRVARSCASTSVLGQTVSRAILPSAFSQKCKAVRDAHPWLEPERILEMATMNGARALHQEDALGKIRAGFQADLIALPIENGSGDIFEEDRRLERDGTVDAGRGVECRSR